MDKPSLPPTPENVRGRAVFAFSKTITVAAKRKRPLRRAAARQRRTAARYGNSRSLARAWQP